MTSERGELVSVTSPRIGRIEMHETRQSGNVSSMRPIDGIPAPEGAEISFQPGGKHLMLHDVDPALVPGDQAILTFHFTKSEPWSLAAAVLSVNGRHGDH